MQRLLAGMLAASFISACGAPVMGVGTMVAPQAVQGVQSASVFGWHGASGLRRALDTFSKEEGRQVTLVKEARVTLLNVALSPDDEARLSRAMMAGLSGPAVILEKNLPAGIQKKALRHLKLMRHQKHTDDYSWTVWTNRLVDNGQTIGYMMQSARGYQALYSDKGKLLSVMVIPKEPAFPIPNANGRPPEDAEPV
jgi:hypothetical protein